MDRRGGGNREKGGDASISSWFNLTLLLAIPVVTTQSSWPRVKWNKKTSCLWPGVLSRTSWCIILSLITSLARVLSRPQFYIHINLHMLSFDGQAHSRTCMVMHIRWFPLRKHVMFLLFLRDKVWHPDLLCSSEAEIGLYSTDAVVPEEAEIYSDARNIVWPCVRICVPPW